MNDVFNEYLPGPVSVLVEFLLLIISTLMSFFERKKISDATDETEAQ